ncbi:MAG: hypothetical protein M3N25_09345, partial [Actinomycetota bacterium]|nr:hypothetical protein [Actinomycetota bacterium]
MEVLGEEQLGETTGTVVAGRRRAPFARLLVDHRLDCHRLPLSLGRKTRKAAGFPGGLSDFDACVELGRSLRRPADAVGVHRRAVHG